MQFALVALFVQVVNHSIVLVVGHMIALFRHLAVRLADDLLDVVEIAEVKLALAALISILDVLQLDQL